MEYLQKSYSKCYSYDEIFKPFPWNQECNTVSHFYHPYLALYKRFLSEKGKRIEKHTDQKIINRMSLLTAAITEDVKFLKLSMEKYNI